MRPGPWRVTVAGGKSIGWNHRLALAVGWAVAVLDEQHLVPRIEDHHGHAVQVRRYGGSVVLTWTPPPASLFDATPAAEPAWVNQARVLASTINPGGSQ